MIHLSPDQILPLVNAEWLGNGPIRLNPNLTLENFPGSLVFTHARLVLTRMDADGGIALTATGNFNRKFIARMVDEFSWPGYEPEVVWRFNKVVNEPDFPPLNFLHAILDLARLGRKYKGKILLGSSLEC